LSSLKSHFSFPRKLRCKKRGRRKKKCIDGILPSGGNFEIRAIRNLGNGAIKTSQSSTSQFDQSRGGISSFIFPTARLMPPPPPRPSKRSSWVQLEMPLDLAIIITLRVTAVVDIWTSVATRFYFPGFPFLAFPGFPAFWHFPFSTVLEEKPISRDPGI
jgi:hypothetical protein